MKTSLQAVAFWPTSKSERCLRGPNTYHVFLRRSLGADRFEAFLAPGDTVAEQIRSNLEREGGGACQRWRSR